MDPERTRLVVNPAVHLADAPGRKPEPEELHTLCDDDAVPSDAHGEFNTPAALRAGWLADQERLTEPATVTVTPGYRAWKTFANIEVEPTRLETTGLTINFTVNCNAAHMCAPHDLVPVYLEAQRGPAKIRFMVVLLEPVWPLTSYRVSVTYSLGQVAEILRVEAAGRPAEELKKAIIAEYSEAALIAQWLAESGAKRPSPNSPNHESGGLLQKGGSGKIQLTPIDLEALANTEHVRNTEWNMGEKLRDGRPVFNRHRKLLAAGEELATTLEAESEYLVDEDTLAMIKAKLAGLAEQPDRWADFGLIHMAQSAKKYTDYYFDTEDCLLLRKSVVLRRRSVPSDPPGTYLLTCKGRTKQFGTEVLRIGAQVRLNEEVMDGPAGPDLLSAFLADTKADSALARVLHDALVPAHYQALQPTPADVKTFTEARKRVGVVLTVVSQRYKVAMKLLDGTVIEFSADEAVGTDREGRTATVFSFEFGVGHPGLNAAGTATVVQQVAVVRAVRAEGGQPNAGQELAARRAQFGKVNAQVAKVVRPYHVPADLTQALLAKSDYQQYVTLRDLIIGKLFGIDTAVLKRGGNKARTIALSTGMIQG